MLNTQTLSESNLSNDIFHIQKRKISEMKSIHESQLRKESSVQTQKSNYLIIKDKEKAKEYSERLNNQSNKSTNNVFEGEVSPFNIKELNVSILDLNCWEFSAFDYEIVNSEEIPFVNSGFLPLNQLESKETNSKTKTKTKPEIEIRNILINLGLEFKLDFTLTGESSLWVFTRSDSNIEFDKYTTIIKLSKEDKSQKCFLTLGTFVYDQRGSKTLKTFLRRQLINYNKSKAQDYYENDYCNFKMSIIDAGEERIQVKVLFNDSNTENDIHGDFFLPMFDYSKVMISGSGQSCVLRSFTIKGFHKIAMQMQGEGKNCECCLVY